jgi:multisubunit Na+/H+ antiporter MnhG subunit
MKLKIEIISLILGLIGSVFMFALISWWELFPVDVRETFRGGNSGAQVMGVFIIVGLLGVFLMFYNLFSGLRNFWWLRLLGYMSFLFLTGSFASLV